ncbi:MAG: hypothetical protein ACE5GM_11295 [bacterium]
MNTELIPFSFNDVNLSESCWIDGKPYFTRRAVGEWLEYPQPHQGIKNIIKRNPHIRDSQWSVVVSLTTTDGKTYEQEVYDPIGLQLIIMESRQPKAKEYKIAVAKLVYAYMTGELGYNNSWNRTLRIEKHDLIIDKDYQTKVCLRCNQTKAEKRGLGPQSFSARKFCDVCGSALATRVHCYLTVPEEAGKRLEYGILK